MKKLVALTVIILFAVIAMPVFAESVFQSLADSIEGSAKASAGTETAAAPAAEKTEAASPAASGEFSATSVFQGAADTVKEMGTEASSARSSSLRTDKEELLKRRQGDVNRLNP